MRAADRWRINQAVESVGEIQQQYPDVGSTELEA
jgi:hypothetical protein